MVFEAIDQLRQHWTDQWVVVDDTRPELKRFAGCPGRVKTVNMNGRALVQFDQYDNIGWYDVDPVYLRIVDAPSPVEKATKAAPAKPDKAESAKAKPATKVAPTADTAKPAAMNVADILAAARGGAAPAQPTASATKSEKQPAPSKPASPAGMSVAEVLAAARGKESASKAEAAPIEAAATKAPPTTPPAPTVADATAIEEPPPQAPPARGKLPSDVAGILAYCREHDRQA